MQPGYVEINGPFLQLIDEHSDGALSGRRSLESETCEQVHGINQATWRRWLNKCDEQETTQARPRLVLLVLEKLGIELEDSRLSEETQRALRDHLARLGKNGLASGEPTNASPPDSASAEGREPPERTAPSPSARQRLLVGGAAAVLVILAVVAAAALWIPPAPALRHESGLLRNWIVDAKHHNIRKEGQDKRTYADPSEYEAQILRTAALALLENQVEQAASLAARIDYELLVFSDQESGRTFHILAEQQPPARGWGTFVFNPEFSKDHLVEIPHPLFDRQTAEIGVDLYLRVPIKGYLMAGSHRNADSISPAINPDVCRNPRSAFQIVHEAWSSPYTRPIQIHGFVPAWLNKECPDDCLVIMSHGTSEITAEHIALDAAFEKAFGNRGKCYVYNELPADHYDNRTVNGTIEGTRFSQLAALTNVQGKFTRRTHAEAFLHVELSEQARLKSEAIREMAITALANYLNYVD
jgi:hypothetical protein